MTECRCCAAKILSFDADLHSVDRSNLSLFWKPHAEPRPTALHARRREMDENGLAAALLVDLCHRHQKAAPLTSRPTSK
jgi:hypothetical protein